MTQGGVSIDVQEQLLKERSRKRKPGTVPYPVKHARDSVVYDNWNVLFLTSLCRSLTLHQFETPPSTILDLGCGGGLWAIEAAKQWPGSTIVGFDIECNQPNLGRPEFELQDIAQRVSFVQGNILEPLPFSSGQFDFVRICGIGLGVPEDEWQFLLEECSRVMAPGGIIEIIEEDLIFPCGKSPRPNAFWSRSQGSAISPQGSPENGGSTSALSSSSDKSSRSSERKPSVSNTSSPSWPKKTLGSHDSGRVQFMLSPRQLEIDQLLDPQDHSRLKAAWLEMLHRRFLNPRLLSVLPFYLSSSFTDMQTHPTLHIALPPNSQVDARDADAPTHFLEDSSKTPEISPLLLDLHAHTFRLSTDSRTDAGSQRSRQSSSNTVSACASIHLARAVQLIRGCKEAMWEEYEHLHDSRDFSRLGDQKYDIRDEFEAAWANWENDMQDRMAMRGRLQESLAWSEPLNSERPDWRIWRERVGDVEVDETESTVNVDNICRSLRGFVAWKPDKTAVHPDSSGDSL